MSLINKMLQDLDARGGAKGGAAPGLEVRAVPERDIDRRALMAGGAALAVLVIAAAGWFGWRYWQQRSVASHALPAPQMQVAQKPFQPLPPLPPLQVAPSAEATAKASPQVQAPDAADKPPARDGEPHHARAKRVRSEEALVIERPAKVHKIASAENAHASAPSPAKPQGSELSLAQQSENAYRRALGSLQEGRVSEAIAGMDNALDLNPRNDGARQTLVGLLVENKRTDEAIRNLRLALAIDAGQPPMAMLLARLQMEQGAPASTTLLRTLPYAKNNAEYHAFLGTALQREQRNAEAAEQYQAALKLAPQNGVWWMALGISLQADKRLPEAKDAYNRAKSSGTLSAELNVFVDRKLLQLAH